MRRHSAGFTLLEVTVALVIAALAAAAMLQAVGTGMRATTGANQYAQAIVRAKSHLAAAAYGSALHASDQQGDDGGGYHWHVRVAPLQSALVRPTGPLGPRAGSSAAVVLYRVIVAISWHEGETTRQVTLQTEQVGGA